MKREDDVFAKGDATIEGEIITVAVDVLDLEEMNFAKFFMKHLHEKYNIDIS